MATTAHLILGNIEDAQFVFSEKMVFRIEHLDQHMERSRTDAGIQYGPTHNALLKIELFIRPDTNSLTIDKNLHIFFERLKSEEDFYYSILYNMTLVENPTTGCTAIGSYENGIVAKGYIIGVEEIYAEGEQSVQSALDSEHLSILIQLTQVSFLTNQEQTNKTIRIFA
ncbi:MAG: hypothetical protein KBT12_02295 [Bacteroidales bacterium]|nr:hypothetical protein [Candidatus Physcousia equi]